MVRWINRAPLMLFVLGSLAIAYGMARLTGFNPLARLGVFGWVAAYFLVIAANFIARSPIQTRGGVVRREDGLLKYLMPYAVLALLGIGAALVTLLAL